MNPKRFSVQLGKDYIVAPDGCWIWQHYCTKDGHGAVGSCSRRLYAHRFVYELHKGQIPVGVECHHRCGNKACVNPNHLELLTKLEHCARHREDHGLTMRVYHALRHQTHCRAGHAFDAVNTYITPLGRRNCRRCRSEANARRWKRMEAQAA